MQSFGRARGFQGLAQGLAGLGAIIQQTALANREKDARRQEMAYRTGRDALEDQRWETERGDRRAQADLALQLQGYEVTPAGQMTRGQAIQRAASTIPGIAGMAARGVGEFQDGGTVRDGEGRQITYNPLRDPAERNAARRFTVEGQRRDQEWTRNRTAELEDREDSQRHARELVERQMRGSGREPAFTPAQQYNMIKEAAEGMAARLGGEALRIHREQGTAAPEGQRRRPGFQPEGWIRNQLRQEFGNMLPEAMIQGIATQAWVGAADRDLRNRNTESLMGVRPTNTDGQRTRDRMRLVQQYQKEGMSAAEARRRVDAEYP